VRLFDWLTPHARTRAGVRQDDRDASALLHASPPALRRMSDHLAAQVQAAVRSPTVVMINEHGERMLQVPCTQDQEPIQAF